MNLKDTSSSFFASCLGHHRARSVPPPKCWPQLQLMFSHFVCNQILQHWLSWDWVKKYQASQTMSNAKWSHSQSDYIVVCTNMHRMHFIIFLVVFIYHGLYWNDRSREYFISCFILTTFTKRGSSIGNTEHKVRLKSKKTCKHNSMLETEYTHWQQQTANTEINGLHLKGRELIGEHTPQNTRKNETK